ncbi:uncharacterized protein LOC133730576 [Rosa rugosa]|uniref:uncharacterized protein LOC133730576 n=1 Tax=Rosa rugosa TaxID=74645 RepID=UPI002B406DD5|nr:uncharacterized protein LOC133730576 [Rosa rugosa]
MALWVRNCGLPVKFFKDYTVAKIGRVLGDVVKVDQVTIGQARGKFARVCIEVDLSKPLRPFVEVESVAYHVVYEGISMICFECGCFGHAKDKCPTLHTEPSVNSQDQDAGSNTNEQVMVPKATSDSQQDMDTSQAHSILKEDMGPWMLMNYRNKRRTNDSGGAKKTINKGSRFTVLQDEEELPSHEPETIIDNATKPLTPPIVKLWASFQDKKKNFNKPSAAKAGANSAPMILVLVPHPWGP